MEEKEQWHLDKKVPIALIFAIVVQSFAAIWWAASVDARLTYAEDTVIKLTLNLDKTEDKANITNERMARVEGMLESIDSRLERITRLLSKDK